MIFSLVIALALQIADGNALRMAGLGSSFAAGPGIPTGQNYAHLVAAKLGANLKDLSVSGSTLLTMTSQIRKIPADSDIITITSGGNDLGYIAGLTTDGLMGAAAAGITAGSSIDEAQLVARFNDDLEKIHTIAPKAKVFLVEYLPLLGPDVVPEVNVPFKAARVEHHRKVAATLLSATMKAAEGKPWVAVVDTAIDTSHGIGSKEPWVNNNKVGSEGGVAWHPNKLGHRAAAEKVYAKIKNS